MSLYLNQVRALNDILTPEGRTVNDLL